MTLACVYCQDPVAEEEAVDAGLADYAHPGCQEHADTLAEEDD